MVASNIKVYLRIRPSARASKTFSAQPDQGIISFELATDDQEDKANIANNSKKIHKFRFDGILEMVVTQEQVFDIIAQPVIEDVLQGINGTIFAYGQTGSGKTFTITGGTERYADRGLIPRSIQYVFQAFRRGEANYVLRVSYLEIYQNDGYDLLVRDDRVAKIEELPRVELREDGDGNIHLRNLSVHTVHAPEEALDLLVIGDTNRVVAETPMNDASTRSHCMFILWIDSTLPGSDTVRRAKLHLVDLAGSERISKTGVEGKLQQEATQINLSLFYLAQVIESLSSGKKGKMHIPYRNSMMTSVLRDSLGGNCKTVMVGTVAVEEHCVDESISTCRFAQRVATIKNDASVNEELDPALLIKRLKNEVAALKDELQLLNGNGEDAEDISDSDKKECRQLVSAYLEEVDPEAPFVCGSVPRFRECFSILREVYWQRQAEDPSLVQDIAAGAIAAGTAGASSLPGGKTTGEAAVGSLERAVLELRQQVVHRDQEIGMLVNSLNMRSKRKEVESASKDGPVFIRGGGAHASKPGRPSPDSESSAAAAAESASNMKPGGRGEAAAGATATLGRSAGPSVSARDATGGEAAPAADSATLLDRNKAFEVFRKSVRRTETLEENREAVVKLVQEAQSLGEKANAERTAREKLKVRVEQARIQQQMESSPRDPEAERATPEPDGPEVQTMLQEMVQHTRNYKQYMQRLGQVKGQIEEFQKTAASNTERLQRDFEAWFQTYAAHQGLSVPPPQAQQSPAAAAQSAQGRTAAQRSSSLPAPVSPRSQASRAAPSVTSEVYTSARPTPEPPVSASPAMDSPLRDSTARGSPAAAVRAVSQQRRLPPSDPGPQAGAAVAHAASSSAQSRRPPLEAAPPRPPLSTAFSSPPASGGPGRPSSRGRGSGAGGDPPGSAAGGGAGGGTGGGGARASSANGAASAAGGPAKVVTGDAETDSEIAAFYAAMAELSKR